MTDDGVRTRTRTLWEPSTAFATIARAPRTTWPKALKGNEGD